MECNVDSAVTMPLGMDADIDRDLGMDMDKDNDSDGLTCPKRGLCSREGGDLWRPPHSYTVGANS
jgi:hypothetical protein